MFIVRLDGAPGFAMACNIMAACINIVLDYLFIFVFEWGLAGAAVATGIGYVVGSGVMLWYMFRRSRTLRFVKLKISGKKHAAHGAQPLVHELYRIPRRC